MDTYTFAKDIIIPGIAVGVAIIGVPITIGIYYRNSKLRRTEWLYSLFEKFFYESRYADIRKLLDYDEEQIVEFSQKLQDHSDVALEEKLVDYLNFFEFISILWQLRQLEIKEIRMMFDYYIRQLGDYDFVMEYLKNQNFEGLAQLVAKTRQMNETK